MKALKELLGLTSKTSERYVSDALPYRELFDDGTVFTKDGRILKIWHVIYPDASIDPNKADSISESIATFFRRKPESQNEIKTTYWFAVARMPINLSVNSKQTGLENMDEGDIEIEKHRQELFFGRDKAMRNVCYCCVSSSISYDSSTGLITEDSLRHCEELFSGFENIMTSLGSRMKALEINASNPIEDTFNFLKYMSGNGDFYAYRSPKPEVIQGELSDLLSDCFIEKGKPMLMGNKYVQVLTINDFPDAVQPDILLGLQTLPFSFKWVTRWIPLNNFESQKLAKKKKTSFVANSKSMKSLYYETTTGLPSQVRETQAVVDADNMESLLEEMASGEVLGYMTATIMISDDSIEGIGIKVKKIKERLIEKGFAAIEESMYQNYMAWKSTLVGDSESGRRKIPLKAMNFAHIIPFTDVYRGFEINYNMKRLSGVSYPLIVGKLFTGELFNFNLNSPDSQLGHFFVIGSTGGGKSVLLALMASQFSRYPGSRVIFFDKDMSFANICKRDKGSIYIPGKEDSPLFFSPLSELKNRPEKAVSWLETVVSASGIKVTADISADFVTLAHSWGSAYPTVTAFTQRLCGLNPQSPALLALQKLIDNKSLNTLFCGEKDGFTYKSFFRKTMIEMGPLMDLDNASGNVAVLPALQFMFDRMDELFDKDPRPTLLIMDEAWKFLSHPAFRTKIKEWLKTLRKKNVFVGFALQNINDIDDAEEFLTSCPTKIYLPNRELKGEEQNQIHLAYEKMGLSASEIKIIADGVQRKEYFIKQPEGSAMVDFCIDRFQLERLARDGI